MIGSEARRGLSVSMLALESWGSRRAGVKARRRALRAVVGAPARRPMPFDLRGSPQCSMLGAAPKAMSGTARLTI
ncbi:hypothetical protein CO652_08590 [Rhizobium sp. H4]|nr:hypothetical protein CO652_08590 [Rhizobium sp. H4]